MDSTFPLPALLPNSCWNAIPTVWIRAKKVRLTSFWKCSPSPNMPRILHWDIAWNVSIPAPRSPKSRLSIERRQTRVGLTIHSNSPSSLVSRLLHFNAPWTYSIFATRNRNQWLAASRAIYRVNVDYRNIRLLRGTYSMWNMIISWTASIGNRSILPILAVASSN